jgi:protein tyrosine phosphatase type 4A
MDAPTNENISEYITLLNQHDVKLVVRACEPSYDANLFQQSGIFVEEMPFTDGEAPPQDIVTRWIDLVHQQFSGNRSNAIAVHCVAGLGRTPVLVVIALIEAGMDPLDAIELIRKKRRGAINAKQLKFLEAYKAKSAGCCIIL